MVVLGLANMRDAAAAVVRDGRILSASEEERFARIKHVTALPVRAIQVCLQDAGLTLGSLDAVAVPWKYWVIGRRSRLALSSMLRSPQLFRVKSRRSAERLRQEWLELFLLRSQLVKRVGPGAPAPIFLDHHLCHAASSFFVSPFSRAAILVVDGASEADTALLAVGEDDRITVLDRVPLPHSLGQFYAAITAFLGFQPDQDEYIVMGLAAYGEPRFAQMLRTNVLRLLPEGRFKLNVRMLDFHLARVGLFTREFVELFGAPRDRADDVMQRHRDLAASAQLVLEETLLHLGRHLQVMSRAQALCLAGGVAYNCVANGRLQAELGFSEVYVPPAAGDAGAALGAALWWTARRGGGGSRPTMPSAYLGPQYEEADMRAALERAGLVVERLPDQLLCERVASELSKGRLVFWYQGRMEWGPRALGNRSLLADPRREDMRALINSKVKFREPFRPFAPSVLAERAAEYFDCAGPSPFMQFAVPVRTSAKGIIPAVTHVDGTARIQTVTRDSNPRFYDLLAAFDRLTGIPILLNTSFNVQEPIVCTPEDAVRCFLRTDVDWLVMGNLLASRQPSVRQSRIGAE
ncbi:MAG TPA: carbamoyltransferase C-terminal domain-containing protein [Nitrospiraceae bacterium]|nr:carbamoyltransferase C-terminal domain-containing protein [Nitrospiraceae bacterium]